VQVAGKAADKNGSEDGGLMSVQATRARERPFKMVLGGADPESVRSALDAAAAAFESLQAEIADLRQLHANALHEIDRMTELERSLLRSCVAAEEDARIRCGAARRYATRIVAAAQEQADARLESPAGERDRIAREIGTMLERRRQAAEALAQLIAGIERAAEPDAAVVGAAESAAVMPVGRENTMPEASDVHSANPLTPGEAAPVVHTSGAVLPMDADRNDVSAQEAAAVPPAAPKHEAAEPHETDRARARKDVDDPAPEWAPGTVIVTRPERAASWAGRRRVPMAAGSVAALLLVLQGSTGMPRVSSPAPEIAAASFAPAAPATRVAQDTTARESSKGTQAMANDAGPQAATAPPLTVRIKPLRMCWVRVVADDRTDARELQPGENIVLEAQRSIVLRVGDAGALSVEVNGRVLPPLGLDGQVVERRFTAAAATK
jgi:cell division septum initiation protein DivIVA